MTTMTGDVMMMNINYIYQMIMKVKKSEQEVVDIPNDANFESTSNRPTFPAKEKMQSLCEVIIDDGKGTDKENIMLVILQ